MQNSKDMKKRRITLSAYYGELKHKNPAKEFITEVCQKCDVTGNSYRFYVFVYSKKIKP